MGFGLSLKEITFQQGWTFMPLVSSFLFLSALIVLKANEFIAFGYTLYTRDQSLIFTNHL